MLKKISLVIVLAGLSSSCFASSPAAWEEFRKNVKSSCTKAMAPNMAIYKVDVDPEGTDSFGVAIATGTLNGEPGVVSQVCIFDKVTEKVEISSAFAANRDDTIDVNVGEQTNGTIVERSTSLDDCLDKANTTLDMNDCRTAFGGKK